MAKKDGKGRIRVFFAEIEGDDDTIQDGLRALTGAVSKTFQPKVVLLPNPTGDSDQPSVEMIEDIVEDAVDESDIIEPVKRKKAGNGKSKPPKLSLVSDLDLRPDGKSDLRTFYSEKNPKTQHEQVAVIVYYLKRILEEPAISADHVYTCLKDVDKKVPARLPTVIRNCASQRGWVDSSKSKDLKITTNGENYVEHDLPTSVG